MAEISQHASVGTMTSPSNGITGGYNGDNISILRAITAFTAIAWYGALEVIILVLLVFKRYKGLYFWSLLISAISIIPYALGAWLKLLQVTTIQMLSTSLLTLSWMVMVPGQSVVLYSRLDLVTQNRALLRGVLYLIIFNTICLCIPTVVLTYGSNITSPEQQRFLDGYEIMEKIQMSLWSVSEIFISVIYLVEIRRTLKEGYEGSTRKLMYALFVINIVIIALDIALLGVEYSNLYEIEITLKGAVYGVKLKLEFGVLSQLVKTVTKGPSRRATATEREMGLHQLPNPFGAALRNPFRSNTNPASGKGVEPENGFFHTEQVHSSETETQTRDFFRFSSSRSPEPSRHRRASTRDDDFERFAFPQEQARRKLSRLPSSWSVAYPGKLGGEPERG